MPFCPKCRYEYVDGIVACPDCGDRLVDSLPEESGTDSADANRDWVPLARLTSQQLAEMLKEALEVKQIPVVISSETGYFGGAAGSQGISSYAPVGGGYVIYIPRELAADADQEAQAILGDEWEKVRIVILDKE